MGINLDPFNTVPSTLLVLMDCILGVEARIKTFSLDSSIYDASNSKVKTSLAQGTLNKSTIPSMQATPTTNQMQGCS